MSKKRRTTTTESAKEAKPASAGKRKAERAPRKRARSDVDAAKIVGLYQEIAAEVTESVTLDEAVERVVERFCSFAPFAFGYGVVNPWGEASTAEWCGADEDRYAAVRDALVDSGRPALPWTADDAEKGAAAADSEAAPPGDAYPSTLIDRALDSGLPVRIDKIEAGELDEADVALEAGLRSAYAFPALFGSEVVAVLAFYGRKAGPLPKKLSDAIEFSLRQLEVVAANEKAERAVRAAARHAKAQAAELNEMAVRLRSSGAHGGDGLYDALTGFPRRRLLLDRLQQALRRRQRNPDLQFAVACIGVEGLREVREQLGLRAADEFLLALCRRMEAALRPADTIARTREDEFTILLEDTEGLADANAAAERIQAAAKRPYRLDGEEVTASASVGLALSTAPYEYAETILRDATAALRASRAFGDEKPRVFDLAEQPQLSGARIGEEELEQAIRDGVMALEYRPIVSLSTGQVAGFEAHVWWQHPERGTLAPEQFLSESGVGRTVSQLLSWSLREACCHVREWSRRRPGSPPYVALALSSEQFYSPVLVSEAWEVLTSIDLDGHLLRFSVGEGALTQSPTQAAQVLASLGALDIGVIMDGFGTGYSSLPHLHQLRPRGIKIERSFLAGASQRPAQWLVARTIVELAHIIDADAVASGIDTREQLARLFQLGCDYAQGPFFGGGLTAEKAQSLVQEGFAAEIRALRSPGERDPGSSPFTRFLAQQG